MLYHEIKEEYIADEKYCVYFEDRKDDVEIVVMTSRHIIHNQNSDCFYKWLLCWFRTYIINFLRWERETQIKPEKENFYQISLYNIKYREEKLIKTHL